jgi:hypothetical protein
MTRSNRRTFLIGLTRGGVLAAFAGQAAGCSGPQLQTVSGVVTLDGQPLPEGIVQFYGPGDRLSTARLRPDGTFVATDILPGDSIQVAVVDDPERAMSRLAPPKGRTAAPPVVQGQPAPARSLRIPAKYKDFKTSDLSFTISPTTPRLDIRLQS